MRLFFAVWPPAAAASGLFRFAQEARKQAGGRATRDDQIHLTLAFLGEADPGRAVAAARRAQGERHALPLEQARYWSEGGIVWAGPRETPPALQALHASLSLELYREEFILERRAFAAHVTLLRDARRSPLPPVPSLDWPVREFALVRSTLSSRGAAYEIVERFPLAGEQRAA